jgi:diguanylate cyclase (GGDEF)-like protein
MFEGFLERLVGQCQTEDIDLTVMMIDVDNFKTLNDTLGHSAGDELLRNIGQLIRSHVREQDAPFRFGGDEFCIVLPGCSPDSAHKLAKRLIELVDGLASTMNLSRKPRLSIGISAMSETGNVPAIHLLERADKQLYEVKAARKGSAPRSSSTLTTMPMKKSA